MMHRRSLPPGAHWQDWFAADGWKIRTVRWPAKPGKPTILFLNGRADYIEKYAEACWQWQHRGYGMMTFDWRGQGLSGRFAQASEGFFATWLSDLAGIADHAAGIVAGPLVLAGHSMGGHLALRHLAGTACAGRFSRAILFAPMVGIDTRGLPQSLLYLLARARIMLGHGDSYPSSQGTTDERRNSLERQRLLTTDPARFSDEAWWIECVPALAPVGASWRWIAETIASCRTLAAAGVPESIRIPVDIFMGSGERLVDARGALRIAQRLPHGVWHSVAGGAHELLRERTGLQAGLHARINALLGDTP